MVTENRPGGFDSKISKFELEYWENFGGVESFAHHFDVYANYFPINSIDFEKESILDIGSGAISVFEKLAPQDAFVTPYDLLADEYNRIAPDKKFKIQSEISSLESFSLVTLFNMIDHVIKPGEVLEFAASHLQQSGRLWLAVHLYQPHGPVGHPQNFSCGSIVELVSAYFHINNCKLIREGVPIPYLWLAELSVAEKSQTRFTIFGLKIRTYMSFFTFQITRMGAKIIKLARLRRFLPEAWRF